MSLRLNLLSCLPDRVVRRPVLDRLAAAAAGAFGTAMPRGDGRCFHDRLEAFAAFTAAQAETILVGDQDHPAGVAVLEVQEQLYQRTMKLGSTLRRRLGIRRPEEALRALEFFYRQIGIEVTGHLEEETSRGGVPDIAGASGATVARGSDTTSLGARNAVRSVPIEITRCFFARRYSEPVCRVIAALDAGVVDGLFGGASLEFSQRLTDGSVCCRAIIRLERTGR